MDSIWSKTEEMRKFPRTQGICPKVLSLGKGGGILGGTGLHEPLRNSLYRAIFQKPAQLFWGIRLQQMGCALKWNLAEHSWDCPCHGSRFDEAGKVLDNPANGDLD